MKLRAYLIASLTAIASPGVASAQAERSANQICSRMIAEGRGGGFSMQDCLCTHRVAEAVLDEDIQALVFDSWLNGTNNTSALERLPNPSRIERQFRTMERTLEANCG